MSALFYTSDREIPTLLHTSSPKKVPLLGGASPSRDIGSAPHSPEIPPPLKLVYKFCLQDKLKALLHFIWAFFTPPPPPSFCIYLYTKHYPAKPRSEKLERCAPGTQHGGRVKKHLVFAVLVSTGNTTAHAG